MLTVDESIEQYPNQVWLEFSSQEQTAAWALSGNYSNDAARWNAHLNCLCLNALIPWLRDECGQEPILWPSPDALYISEFVNGTALALEETRIVLIPSEAIDIEEFCVPQEWVDIPSWTANYYLAVQVNPDEGWLRVWGYATHQQLKNKGSYDELERTYSLEREDVIENLNVMWVARELCPNENVEVEPLPILSQAEVERLLVQLSQPSSYFPQLDVEFKQWAALLENATWKQQLYERRLGKVVAAVAAVASALEKKVVNLSGWLQNVFEEGWQMIEELFGTREAIFAFRSGLLDANNSEDISHLINLIYNSSSELLRRQAAEALKEVNEATSEIINALIHLLISSEDDETLWAAIDSLRKIDPGNPAIGLRRGKLMDLGMQLADNAVALEVSILPKADETTRIRLRLYPVGSQIYLPPTMQLIVLDECGENFLKTQARSSDNYIQLKFSGECGEMFSVQVALGEASLTENFII